jgi:2-oxoglutarate ferredoxin oxidoreductase subunit beta
MVEASLIVKHPIDEYLRIDRVPYTWCPGCGIGTALQHTLRAVKELVDEGVIERKNILFVTGIGCTGRAAGLVNLDAAHVVHGRAIPFAIGAKLANPNIQPIVFSGDGDIAGIGGNHLLHAARKNMDLLVIMINNLTYALTGGQLAPTTPYKVYSTTTPYGNPETPMDTAKTLMALEVNYIARWSITHLIRIKNSVKYALKKRGFRFIEILSACPEIFGRHIKIADPVALYNKLKKISKVKSKVSFEDIKYDWNEEITCGVFVDRDNPGYFDSLLHTLEEIRHG